MFNVLWMSTFQEARGWKIKLCCRLSDQQRAAKLCSNLRHKIPPNETHLTYIYSNLSHSKSMLSLSYKLYINSVYAHIFFFSFLLNYLKDQHAPFIRWFCSNFILKSIILKLLRPAFDKLSHLETNLLGNFKATFAFRDAIFCRAWLQPAAVWLPVAVWRSLWTLLHTCTELVACDWLVSFLYSKAIGHKARWGRMVCNNCKRPFFFPKRWLEFYDQMTKITAPLSEICERLLSPTHKQHKCVNSYTKQLCHRHVRLHCMWNIPQRPPRILYSTSDKSVDS